MITIYSLFRPSRSDEWPGDRWFSGTSLFGDSMILETLAAVAIFLVVQWIPGVTATRDTARCSTAPSGSMSPRWLSVPSGLILALLMAVPLSIRFLVFISHYAPRRLPRTLGYVVDLLAAVPSVVFGLWGIIVVAPPSSPCLRMADLEHGLVPAVRRHGLQHRPHDGHGRGRAGGHGHADHHRDLAG